MGIDPARWCLELLFIWILKCKKSNAKNKRRVGGKEEQAQRDAKASLTPIMNDAQNQLTLKIHTLFIEKYLYQIISNGHGAVSGAA